MNHTVKNGNGFTNLQMYASCYGKMFKYDIKEENATWKTIKIESISVRNGKVEIGFMAEGSADSFCYVDDISLVKSR